MYLCLSQKQKKSRLSVDFIFCVSIYETFEEIILVYYIIYMTSTVSQTPAQKSKSSTSPKTQRRIFRGAKNIFLSLLVVAWGAFTSCNGDLVCEWCKDPTANPEAPTCNDIDIYVWQNDLCEQIDVSSAAFAFQLAHCDDGYKDLSFNLESSAHGILSYEVVYNIPGGWIYVWNDNNDKNTITPAQMWVPWVSAWSFTLRVHTPDGTNAVDVTLDAGMNGALDIQWFRKELDPWCTTIPVINDSSISIDTNQAGQDDGVLSADVELCPTLDHLDLDVWFTFGHAGPVQYVATDRNGNPVFLASHPTISNNSNQYTGSRRVSKQDINNLWYPDFSEFVSVEVRFWSSPRVPRNNTIPTGQIDPADPSLWNHRVILSLNGVNIVQETR